MIDFETLKQELDARRIQEIVKTVYRPELKAYTREAARPMIEAKLRILKQTIEARPDDPSCTEWEIDQTRLMALLADLGPAPQAAVEPSSPGQRAGHDETGFVAPAQTARVTRRGRPSQGARKLAVTAIVDGLPDWRANLDELIERLTGDSAAIPPNGHRGWPEYQVAVGNKALVQEIDYLTGKKK